MTQQAFGFHTPALVYPDAPGAKVDGPSREAAETVDAATIRAEVYACLAEMPQTADECAAHLDRSILTVRPRCSELRAQGRIVDSGLRRVNQSGKRATVWRVTP